MPDWLNLIRWPLVASLILPGILVYYGLHIIQREIIFVDLALAQVAALGSCLAILLGYEPTQWQSFVCAAAFTLVGAAMFTLTRTPRPGVPQEALIGIVYVVAAAAGVLLLSKTAEGNEELRRTLVGDVLLVRGEEVLKTLVLYVAVAVVHWVFRHRFLALTFGLRTTADSGGSWRRWEFLFYALFGFVVTSFVQIGGVLLVFSYLIVPAVLANLFSKSLAARLAIGWVTAMGASLVGIGVSFKLDLPTGAAIVCALGLCLALGLVVTRPTAAR